MQIQDYVNVIWRRWWIILLVMFSAAVAAYGFSKLRTPIYRSQAALTVIPNRIDTGAISFADRLLNGYISLAYNPNDLQSISDQLRLDRSGSWLMEYVRVQGQPTQLKIVVEADYYDPENAQRLAASVSERLMAAVAEQNRTATGEDRLNIKQTQSAMAAWKAKPNTRINVLAGSILGAILGLLLAFMLEYADDTLKNSADVERFAGLTTIGAIPSSAWDQGRARRRLRPAVASGFIASGGLPRASGQSGPDTSRVSKD